MKPTPFFIGIAGGTSSGKTSLAKAIRDELGSDQAVLLSHDAYYVDPSVLPFEERTRINYDHPDAYETSLLIEHLSALESFESVPRLAYDFVEHARVNTGDRVEPRPIVLIEGNLVLAVAPLRERFDLKIYVDADADVRVLRRIARDIQDRGRTLESVTHQYLESVRPMHLEYMGPSRRFADLVVPEGAHNETAVSLLIAGIRAMAKS